MAEHARKRKADMKVVLLGEASVGKTSLLCRYIDGVFQETVSTIGASFSLKQWGRYNVAIWDTAGEERFSGLSSFYCRGASAAILAFDITRKQSFDSLRERFLPLLDAAEENCLKIVVGTKLDLVTPTNREITAPVAEKFARTVNERLPGKIAPYFETSSRTGQGVQEMFHYIFNTLLPLDSQMNSLTNSPISRRNEKLRGTVNLQSDGQNAEAEKKCCLK